MSEYKQCIVTRDDLKLSKGKFAVQVAHAALSAAEWASKGDLEKWKEGGQKKIVLKVPSIKELYELKEKARREGSLLLLYRTRALLRSLPEPLQYSG